MVTAIVAALFWACLSGAKSVVKVLSKSSNEDSGKLVI
jgi:hypothetical protein